jgi:vacuolar iron transporter family protein
LKQQQYGDSLATKLILDELFDLSLYRALREIATGPAQKVLDELVRIETGHFNFWQDFFGIKLRALDLPRRLKLSLLIGVCRVLGTSAIHLVLEAIEVYGVQKYLALWKRYKDEPLGTALHDILVDEFKHEDTIVTELTKGKINPERIRNIFLGLNDGLVEILGAVSGFFGAFGDAVTVLIAALTIAVAGSLSMAAGAYGAISSEREVEHTGMAKREFLGEDCSPETEEHPLRSGLVVGSSYFVGAMVPVLPILFGAKDVLYPLVTAGSVIIVVSTVLAFLSGMDIKRRILTNLVIVAGAVAVTYGLGILMRQLWGVSA